MEAEEFVELWHASFGSEAQPPESCSNLGRRLSAQDVGTELRARETRVETLRTQLEREERALEWLRRLAADLQRRETLGEDPDPPRLDERGNVQSAISHPDRPVWNYQNASEGNKATPVSYPPRPGPDLVYSTNVEVSLKSRGGLAPTCDSRPHRRTSRTKSDSDAPDSEKNLTNGPVRSGEGERNSAEVTGRERSQSQSHGTADKNVARAVRKRLIEQGKWWSSNLLTLEVSSQAQTPQISRRRCDSVPPLHCHPGQQRQTTVPTVRVHEVIESFEQRSQESAHKANPGVSTEKEVLHVSHHVSQENVNKDEKQAPLYRERRTEPEREKIAVNPPVRRTKSQREDEENYVFKNHVFYSTRSLNRRPVRSRLSQLEEEGPTSSTLKRRPTSSIEAKLANRRRTGGWKVVEVGGQKRPLSKTPSPQHSSSSLSKERTPEKCWGSTEGTNTHHSLVKSDENVPVGLETRRNTEANLKRGEKLVSRQPNMIKAAKEKLSRVTSSPPLRRRPSRGSRGREGAQHRSSNGQVESRPTTTPPPLSGSPAGVVAGVQEVMVEKRVERSESLLSEILSHRFSNGMEGSQLLESGEHSLVGSQEVGGDAGKVTSMSENVPKVILRRRSERENDPLPEAKRRSSCLEDDDCSTPKDEFSLSLTVADEGVPRGLTKAMVDASVNNSQVQRLASDSTLRQESFEATLTPANVSGSSPTNVNFRMSYMTAVHESPHMTYTAAGGLREAGNQMDYMPLINETDGEMAGIRLPLVSSEPNLLELHSDVTLEDSMELDEATISAVTLNNDMFGSRSGSVTSLPETLDDSQSTSTASLTEPFLSPAHTPAPVVNLRQSGSGAVSRRRNRRREGNAELDDQTGASLDEMLLSERLRSPNTTASSSQYSVGSLSPTAEEVILDMSGSPTTPTLFSPPHHATHLKELEVYIYIYIVHTHTLVFVCMYECLFARVCVF